MTQPKTQVPIKPEDVYAGKDLEIHLRSWTIHAVTLSTRAVSLGGPRLSSLHNAQGFKCTDKGQGRHITESFPPNIQNRSQLVPKTPASLFFPSSLLVSMLHRAA